MSENDSSEIKERLARMEERQKNISTMLEMSLSRYADLVNRVSALEVLKHRMLGMVAVAGFLFTIGWEILKTKFLSKP
jgi:hypothetical protein